MGIAAGIGHPLQPFLCGSGFEISRALCHLLEQLPRCRVPTIQPALLSLLVGDRFRHATRPVEIQIGIEVLPVKRAEGFGMSGSDYP